MPNAKDLDLTKGGIFTSLIGVPGSGKSHFARSAIRYAQKQGGKAFVFMAPAAELAGYAGMDVEYELLVDEDWRPSMGSYGYGSYNKLMTKLAEFEKSALPPGSVIVFDTMSAGPSDAIWHLILGPLNTDDPAKLNNKYAPYTGYASRFSELMDRLDLLRFKQRVHIIALWHEDVREAEGQGAPRKETVKEGGDLVVKTRWDAARLPMMRGGLRQDVSKWFDLNFYASPVVGSAPFRCELVVVPDGTRLAKSRLHILEALQKKQQSGGVPNDFAELMKIVATATPRSTT